MNITRHIILVIVIFLASCSSGNKNGNHKEASEKSDSIVNQKFVSEEYEFSAYYPTDWNYKIFEIGSNQTIISFYRENTADSIDFPLKIHENAGLSFISIFPDGYGTEYPSGKTRSIEKESEKTIVFEVNTNESLAFILENDQEWGFFIVPSSPPESWDKHGFLFAQVAVDDFEITCFDKNSGEELEMSDCDPLAGDSVVRYGKVVQEDLQTIKRILNSIQFEESNNGQPSDSRNDAKGIAVTSPRAGSVITTPVEITGKARGSWFFEALIEIELRKDGTVLGKTTGKAEGNWMTQDYVEFAATLTFPEGKETGKAELLFRSSNPSGKSSMEKSFSIPVELR